MRGSSIGSDAKRGYKEEVMVFIMISAEVFGGGVDMWIRSND